MLAYQPAETANVKSLRNWIENTSSIASSETAYLSTEQDLLSVCPESDDPLLQIELFLEQLIVLIYKLFKKVCRSIETTKQPVQ